MGISIISYFVYFGALFLNLYTTQIKADVNYADVNSWSIQEPATY